MKGVQNMFKRKPKFYNIDNILKKNSVYNIIIGERSNGKTYTSLKYALEHYFKTGGQLALVRRWREDIKGRRATEIFTAHNVNGEIEKLSKGEFKGVHYYNSKFYLCNYDENNKPIYSDKDVFAYSFALSESEHNKSISYPKIETIIFDEFLTNKLYLNDEFVLFMNTVSTIVRQRTNVKIFMLGNTVNKFSPYFEEMGLTHIQQQQQGTIDVYTYGDSELTVAVEYCKSTQNSKENNFYFAFNNPKLHMITGGAWELGLYPHLPFKYTPKDIIFTYFILFNNVTYQCEIISKYDTYITYIHIKTTELKNDSKDLIYSLEISPKMNYNSNIYKPMNSLQSKILWFYKNDKVFYQNNDVGNSIHNFLKLNGA